MISAARFGTDRHQKDSRAPGAARVVVSRRKTPAGIAASVLAAVALTACAVGPGGPGAGEASSAPPARRVAPATADAMRLQSDLLALGDTVLGRVTAATAPGASAKDPETRKFSLNSRLALGTAVLGIVTGPDPVDALLDMLTHTTLVADAAGKEAAGKPATSPQAQLHKALELNEADTWKLAERWVEAPTRAKLRAHILSWPGARNSAAEVAYVRLSDVPRSGATSAEAGSGMISSMRAAVQQAEQVRLFGERALFLAQRTPYALRWQAEVLTFNTMTMEESQRLLASIGGLTATADAAVREVSGMPALLSKEREATLRDLFARIEHERKATLEHMALIIEKERSATLAEAGVAVNAQRKAIVQDLLDIAARAERQGEKWAQALLVIGLVLIVALLLMLFGLLLLYRRLLLRMMERHPPAAH